MVEEVCLPLNVSFNKCGKIKEWLIAMRRYFMSDWFDGTNRPTFTYVSTDDGTYIHIKLLWCLNLDLFLDYYILHFKVLQITESGYSCPCSGTVASFRKP